MTDDERREIARRFAETNTEPILRDDDFIHQEQTAQERLKEASESKDNELAHLWAENIADTISLQHGTRGQV